MKKLLLVAIVVLFAALLIGSHPSANLIIGIGMIVYGLILAWFISVALKKHEQLIFMKYKFRYFSLRDRLALLVVTGKLDEKSPAYKHVVDMINFHIKTVETMSFQKIAILLSDYHSRFFNEEEYDESEFHVDEMTYTIIYELLEVTEDLLVSRGNLHIKVYEKYLRGTQKGSKFFVPLSNLISKIESEQRQYMRYALPR